MKPLAIGRLVLDTPLLLAPMCGYFDCAYRTCQRDLGGLGLAFTEMINPRSFLQGIRHHRVSQLLFTTPQDVPLAYQLYGTDPGLMREGAQACVERGAVLVDVNMGCTKPKVTRKGAGAALIRTPEKAAAIVKAMAAGVSIPVTVKIRLGWDNSDEHLELARQVAEAGAAAVTLHARRPEQGFSGKADMTRVAELVQLLAPLPVIANGDIRSVASAITAVQTTGCAGLMIGRGARSNPWLIRDAWQALSGRPHLPHPSREDLETFRAGHRRRVAEVYGEAFADIHLRKWTAQYIKWAERETWRDVPPWEQEA